jgi:hypothetical protein
MGEGTMGKGIWEKVKIEKGNARRIAWRGEMGDGKL